MPIGPQRGPASVRQIMAQTAQVNRELREIAQQFPADEAWSIVGTDTRQKPYSQRYVVARPPLGISTDRDKVFITAFTKAVRENGYGGDFILVHERLNRETGLWEPVPETKFIRLADGPYAGKLVEIPAAATAIGVAIKRHESKRVIVRDENPKAIYQLDPEGKWVCVDE